MARQHRAPQPPLAQTGKHRPHQPSSPGMEGLSFSLQLPKYLLLLSGLENQTIAPSDGEESPNTRAVAIQH